MILTEEQRAALDGRNGVAAAKVMETLVLYGEALGAGEMARVTSNSGHLTGYLDYASMKPAYKIIDGLVRDGIVSSQPFSFGPRHADVRFPAGLLRRAAFRAVSPFTQRRERQLRRLGLIDGEAFSCACFLQEVGNIPSRGDVLSWSGDGAVVYANSVLGARCNRNPFLIGLFGSIADCVPKFGLLTDEGRRPDWIVELRLTSMPDPQLLGAAIGRKVFGKVPYIKGLDSWIGAVCTQEACDFLKDMGAAAAYNGRVGLFHVDNLTPEAVEYGESLVSPDAGRYVVDDDELEKTRDYCRRAAEKKEARGERREVCFIGCPHLSLAQLVEWTRRLGYVLKASGSDRARCPVYFMAAPGVLSAFEETAEAVRLKRMGGIVTEICPMAGLAGGMRAGMRVITSSCVLSQGAAAEYCTEDEILQFVTGGFLDNGAV
jgi:predicted aconitase